MQFWHKYVKKNFNFIFLVKEEVKLVFILQEENITLEENIFVLLLLTRTNLLLKKNDIVQMLVVFLCFLVCSFNYFFLYIYFLRNYQIEDIYILVMENNASKELAHIWTMLNKQKVNQQHLVSGMIVETILCIFFFSCDYY